MIRAASSGKEGQVSLTPEQLALKAAFAEVKSGVGGVDACEANCRASKSQIARYYDPNCDQFVPVDVLATLEPLARNRPGWPHVTRKLARDLGFALIERPRVDAADCPTLHASLRAAMDKSGRLHVGMVEALGDGKVTAEEARPLIAAAMEAAEENLHIHALLKRIWEEC